MNKNYFLKGGILVNEGKKREANLLLKEGLFLDILNDNESPSAFYLKENNFEEINASGNIIIPGVIDDQVHFREPGLTHKGDIYTESRAAVAGGVTSFMEMPNTVPNTVTNELLEEKYVLAKEKSACNYSFFLGATNDNMDEIRKFDADNNPGIKLFMGASTGNMLVDNSGSLENIFKLPFLIAIHSEDESIIRQNIQHFKELYGEEVPIEMHPQIRSREACYSSTKKAVQLARKLNTRLHVLHLSTEDELEFFTNEIPLDQKKITNEVCVHHLWFNDADYAEKGSFIKWNPAIKTEKDRKALFDAVKSGLIDIVATDHAPHTLDEKKNTYFKAPSGGPLIQHSLLAMLDFVQKNELTIDQLVDVMCHKPAQCFKVRRRGFIRKNYFADLVMLDMNGGTLVTPESLLYKCKWSPFEGHRFNAKIVRTFVNGNSVYTHGNIDESIKGQRLAFN
jgi:dihydroorotase